MTTYTLKFENAAIATHETYDAAAAHLEDCVSEAEAGSVEADETQYEIVKDDDEPRDDTYTHIDTYHLDTDGRTAVYNLDEDETRAWGAYEDEGVEAEDHGEFRRALKAELQQVANELCKPLEVHADGTGIDAQDWIATVLVPDDE